MPPLDEITYVYRGVHAKHPMRAAALKKTVIPGDPNGDMTPTEHNRLDLSDASPFTSWSASIEVARRFAKSRGSGRVLLRLPRSEPQPGDSWSWHESPDTFGEKEIILKGIRMDAEEISSTLTGMSFCNGSKARRKMPSFIGCVSGWIVRTRVQCRIERQKSRFRKLSDFGQRGSRIQISPVWNFTVQSPSWAA